jgi:lipoprotein-anchoring transpeptidase ErfK/SrfK
VTSRRRLLPLLATSLALAGCGAARPPAAPTPGAASPAAPAPPVPASLVARAVVGDVGIYAAPAAARPRELLGSPNHYGFRLVLLVKRALPGWLEVYLPQRPNGSTGWVRRRDVAVGGDPYLLRIDLRRRRLTLLRRGTVLDRTPIGVGRAVTPTPSGLYYITELFRLTDASGPYGPYGFGLSAYSDVLHEFAGADGQIGIHGTNDPGGIGHYVSHGCIRLHNAEISRLARLLPLGTPVRIVRS